MKKNAKQDQKLYTLGEAITRVKNYSKEKFDPSIEIHISLNTDPKKQDQSIRFSITLPNGTGKTLKVAVFASTKVNNADLELTEDDLVKIEKNQIRPKVDFDVLVSEPKFMPKLARVAKILGPAGVMPNPKTGTVSENVGLAVDQIKKGKVEIKTEKDAAVIHTIIGKRSFEDKALEENFKEIVNTLKQNKPSKLKVDLINNIYMCTSMGQSVKIDLNTL